MSARLLVQEVILGLITGSTYVLVAVGFTLIYGVMRLINFAQLTIYTMGAFIYVGMYLSLIHIYLRPNLRTNPLVGTAARL